MNLFKKYDPYTTRKRYTVRGNGKSIYFDCTEKSRELFTICGGVPVIFPSNALEYNKENNVWVGEMIRKARITEIHIGGHTDIKIPLQIIAKIESEGEREIKTFYKYEEQPIEKFVNGPKLLGTQVEYLEHLNEVEKARLENISIFEVRDTLLAALAASPRIWSDYLSALQEIYNCIDNKDYFEKKTVKVPYKKTTDNLINANIELNIGDYQFYLTEGGRKTCSGVEIKSYLFELPRAEIIKNYIKEVLI